MERIAIYAIEDILSRIGDDKIILNGKEIMGNTKRLRTLKRSIKCKKCGIQGVFFALEKTWGSNRFHLNLYALDDRAQDVLMTRDHIIPLSKGGEDTMKNSQTLCLWCNQKKGNS